MSARWNQWIEALADRSLALLIILAPLAAGGWRIEVLPFLVALAVLGYAATLYTGWNDGRGVHVQGLHLGLAVFAGFTLLQAIPLGSNLLAFLSPTAAELRAFVGADAASPISYEPAASLREAAKLLLYLLVALIAHERTRARRDPRLVTVPLVLAGLAAVVIALAHRAVGAERLYGFFDTWAQGAMLSTFVNPNHTAGFMALVALTSIGLGISARRRDLRLGYLAVAALAGGVSVLVLSKGGLLALFAGLVLFWVVLRFSKQAREDTRRSSTSTFVAIAILVPLIGVVVRLGAVLEELGVTGQRYLGLKEKWDALRDSWALILDHAFWGIGRGAYISVYPRYKTSSLQLTFQFPENLGAQLLAEWGLIMGSLAVIALVVTLVVRLKRVQRVAVLGSLTGVAALLFQNQFDFSMELPGVAIPVVAVLSAAGVRQVRSKVVMVKSPFVLGTLILVPSLALIAVTAGAFVGDLARDMDTLDARIAARDREREPPLSELLARHPASAVIAAKIAYFHEISTPPDLPAAVRAANQALYLAPTYADGHLLAGRLLLRKGHRKQGFVALREAWRLSDAQRQPTVRHLIELSQTPAELLAAVPRRDPELDLLDESILARAIPLVISVKSLDFARALLADQPQADTNIEALREMLQAAKILNEPAASLRLSTHGLALAPKDPALLLAHARALIALQRPAEAEAVLAGLPADAAVLELRIELAMGQKNLADAEALLTQLRAAWPPTLANQVRLAEFEAQIAQAAGKPNQALEALDKAVAADPGRITLRWRRAQLLLSMGKRSEARVELRSILERQPGHVGARRLLDQTAP